MNVRSNLRFTVVAVACLVAAVATAKTKDSKDIVFHHDVTIGGSHLASGDYSVTWKTHSPEATVTFLRGNKVVATAEGKVVDRGTRYGADEVLYGETPSGGRQIQEIRFRGSSQVIVFGQ